MTELISRADAIKAVASITMSIHLSDVICDKLLALPSAELTLQTPQTYGKSINPSNAEVVADYISRADAIELLTEIVFDEPPYFDSETLCRLYAEEQINTLPSAEIAETEPIVIRSKTLLPTKDFKEWAKRIKEVNPNAVVIPCDAEVASADDVHGEWIWRTDIPIGDGRTSAGYICSNCGKDYWHGNVFDFCPNCGARMKGGAE